MSDKDYIKAKLESAGKTMMMLPATGTKPKGYASGWPEIVREFADMIEAPKQNTQTPIRATMSQMNELNEVEGWIVKLGAHCREQRIPHVSKTVAALSLRWPVSDKPVFTASKYARIMGKSHTTIKRWHDDGIDIIRRHLLEDGHTFSKEGNIVLLKPR